MDIYHANCIACHEELYDAGEKTGPTELCGECHKETPSFISARQQVGFDKYLHAFHLEMIGEDCSTCHHDNRKEGSCRECHKDDDSNKLISMRAASHISCIKCHIDSSGPTKCNSCHNIAEQQKFDKSGDVSRLMAGQPDIALIGAKSPEKGSLVSAGMNPVPFDHKAHEESQDTCRVCHHRGIESCSQSCHTSAGAEKGNMIRTEQAMHQLGNEQSCLGCHEINKKQKECAGCHGLIGKEKHSQNNQPFS